MNDRYLMLLGDLNAASADADEAIKAGEYTTAGLHLDSAEDLIQQLRDEWPNIPPGPARVVTGSSVKQLQAKIDSARTKLPVRRVVSEGAPEIDPEQETDPDAE
jgi:hypothetical protein